MNRTFEPYLTIVQDTSRLEQIQSQDTSLLPLATDSVNSSLVRSEEEIMSLFEATNRREKTRDSLESLPPPVALRAVQPEEARIVHLDSNHIIFSYQDADNWPARFDMQPPNQMLSPVRKNEDFFIYTSTNKPSESIPVSTQRSGIGTPDWFLIVFALVLILLARLRLFYGKFLVPVLSSTVNFQTAHTLYRNKNLLYQRASLGLTAVFVLIMPLFLLQVINHYDWPTQGINNHLLYLVLMGLILAWYGLKFLVTWLVGYFSGTLRIFEEYFHSFELSSRSLGIFLIPLTILLAYGRFNLDSALILTSLFVILSLYILRIFRLFSLFVSKSVSVSYSILYLCALEILPLLVLFRLLVPLEG